MAELTLYIGNKNYSSWSLRPWIAMKACGIPFSEVLIPFDMKAGNPKFRTLSPVGRVPVLHHDEIRIWESLAIIEYVAELFPEAGLWPKAQGERALARSISMEMLSGFGALRSACPMNIRRQPAAIPVGEDVRANVRRIEAIWKDCRQKSGGPFLFGAFSAADAMFAPAVNRFEVYELVSDPETLAYMTAVKQHPAWVEWQHAALAETWYVEKDEV
ncbi:glutathione S-transferase family protein [Gellertiella hungarica]|uniref:Glutathione S-transferase n=1 Tax=Gellertiella hungarica TaxID=1572859 RepID=A0A7W6J5U6_9HYPH|nr:glutathione S-transferase family protein [Gellertiella hungarica]MBB4065329.1 glutathione S-transferase [Gellertiella hungarica]